MKVYIASRLIKRDYVKGLNKLLINSGHTIPFDWTKGRTGKSMKPYDKNVRLSRTTAKREISAISNCDIFILISDRSGTGMYVELGAAIVSQLTFGRPQIFVLGKYTSHTLFYFHPSITIVSTIDQLMAKLTTLETRAKPTRQLRKRLG